MKTCELKVARIGNSRGVRLPAEVLRRYAIRDSVILEEREEGVLLRPPKAVGQKLTWAETARAMAEAAEDWSAWDAASGDGLANIPWEGDAVHRVAEKKAAYSAKPRGGRKA